jgi:hypothetical protein
MPLGLNPGPGSARNLKPIKPIKSIELIEATVQKKTTPKDRRWFGCSAGVKSQRLIQKGSKGAEEHIGEQVVEFDHDDGGDGKPDRRKYRSCGEELLHGLGSRGCGWNERMNRY